ncbi:DUF4252 domain-containing protein [Marinilabilia rubra]|uniref:DUF4252 domain-containing protein n=1 Tax=Marinilabilia rubra TaxID=2162893 RepID=A0A2U2BBP8_9BACT|nr:DUF4252 domain-containing protein [Marinilabilia rubra]PWE00457.1 DUF4252 domain-containing protein [Marinilabilia rubra]
MRTIFLVSIIAWFSAIAASGQASASDKLYLQLEGADGVTIMSLSKDIIDMVDMVVDDNESKQVTGPLEKIKMMICNEDEGKEAINAVINTFEKRPFAEVEDEDNDERVFIIRKGRKIKECHIVGDKGEGLILLSFYGDFKIEDIDELVDKAEEIN